MVWVARIAIDLVVGVIFVATASRIKPHSDLFSNPTRTVSHQEVLLWSIGMGVIIVVGLVIGQAYAK